MCSRSLHRMTSRRAVVPETQATSRNTTKNQFTLDPKSYTKRNLKVSDLPSAPSLQSNHLSQKSIHHSFDLSIHPNHPFTHSPIHQFTHPPIHQSMHPPIRQGF